jgi:hypothetical protein
MKDEIKLEAGKKYIVPHDGDELYTFIDEILAFPKDKDRQFVFIDSKGKYVFYSISYIKGIKEHIEEPMQEETKEVKLEVGKKYYFNNCANNPYRYVCEDKDFPEGKYIFRDDFGNAITTSFLGGVKEHREPFKQIFEGWVWYDSDMPLCRTNKKYYETKEECLRYTHNSTKAIKIRVTEEEILDKKA